MYFKFAIYFCYTIENYHHIKTCYVYFIENIFLFTKLDENIIFYVDCFHKVENNNDYK